VSGKSFYTTAQWAKIDVLVAENPYAAAQRFLEQNELSLNYIDEVVKFLEKNTERVSLGVSNDYVNPYNSKFQYSVA